MSQPGEERREGTERVRGSANRVLVAVEAGIVEAAVGAADAEREGGAVGWVLLLATVVMWDDG